MVGLGVGVFFCVLGVSLVIYCITRASGCYGNGRTPSTEIKITYFEDGKSFFLHLELHICGDICIFKGSCILLNIEYRKVTDVFEIVVIPCVL